MLEIAVGHGRAVGGGSPPADVADATSRVRLEEGVDLRLGVSETVRGPSPGRRCPARCRGRHPSCDPDQTLRRPLVTLTTGSPHRESTTVWSS
ncbi:MAG: hypothetical protein R2710_02880 [Acidimicrobiales bacterium]